MYPSLCLAQATADLQLTSAHALEYLRAKLLPKLLQADVHRVDRGVPLVQQVQQRVLHDDRREAHRVAHLVRVRVRVRANPNPSPSPSPNPNPDPNLTLTIALNLTLTGASCGSPRARARLVRVREGFRVGQT